MDENTPLFKQESPKLLRLFLLVSLFIALLITDVRFRILDTVREAISIALQPLQRVALFPRDALLNIASFFTSKVQLRKENDALRERNTILSFIALRASAVERENDHLRALLDLQKRLNVIFIASKILYETHNPFARIVIIDKGLIDGIKNGAPVINEEGLLGQVTRTYPIQAEVSLITDKNLSIPVQNQRTGKPGVLYGTSHGSVLELRFETIPTDIRINDTLITSGLDGIYPSGIPVARITDINKKTPNTLIEVLATPIANSTGNQEVLVMKCDSKILYCISSQSSIFKYKGGERNNFLFLPH